ncbi:MAG: conjugal transfer protein TraX [Clostridiales bacterium]|nr:conjugal transfer protein TraX [Clostridiales bacterium]
MLKDYPSVKSVACVNGLILKWIAVITMLIDHVGAVLFPYQMGFRYVGRIAFPIFCFMLVEGFINTRSVRKYEIRLLIFAIISEIPFDLAFYRTSLEFTHQNVFFTLFLGLLMLDLIRFAGKKTGPGRDALTMEIAILVLFMVVAYLLRTDYSEGGVLLIYCLWRFRGRHVAKHVCLGAILLVFYTGIELFGLIAILPMILYNGQRGFKDGLYSGQKKGAAAVAVKYAFYIFYPVHLLIIHFMSVAFRY